MVYLAQLPRTIVATSYRAFVDDERKTPLCVSPEAFSSKVD